MVRELVDIKSHYAYKSIVFAHENIRRTAPKSPAYRSLVRIPTPDAFLVCLFSACANEIIRLFVRLRRLGTVGIFPFQSTNYLTII